MTFSPIKQYYNNQENSFSTSSMSFFLNIMYLAQPIISLQYHYQRDVGLIPFVHSVFNETLHAKIP
jgi:hypothetical protein